MKLKLNELEVFIAVAESNSFNLAAERLDIASSVVSRSIKKLERDLETTLFNRTTRSVTLTAEGAWLIDKARHISEEAVAIEHHFLQKHKQPQGTLTVDTASSFALHAIVPLLSDFTRLYPDVKVALVSNDSITDLIERKVDVAIRVGQLSDSTLKARKLGVVQRGLYASPSYLNQLGYPDYVTQLSKHQCLGFDKYKYLNTWPLIDNTGKRLSITPQMSSNSGETLKQMAVNGLGIACLSNFTVQQELESGSLKPVLKSLWVSENIPINAVFYSEQSLSPRVRVFIDFLVGKIKLI
ncbi:LysR substrate-binding domain-containing protein (plasmid) [Photobacterium sp. DA100]|uniref:LysR substrate-binding domain-containing protein n=1 Tax=Photobacterium sp. DA100 TaxID=3027472 RepID=UPI00247A6C1C|nr:LysR substrate-binding domain-containing protein [Photobacterium sp. DA100]WEM44196.1 LysR substrate-binding domain-containing protein [Photobacterium sp. DA100]